jgi:hypothetical protein
MHTSHNNSSSSPPANNLTDVLYMSAVINAETDPSHIDHYNTVVSAQNLLDALDDQLEKRQPPAKLSSLHRRTPISNSGPAPHLILAKHTIEDKQKRHERFQMSRELIKHRLDVEEVIGTVDERRLVEP